MLNFQRAISRNTCLYLSHAEWVLIKVCGSLEFDQRCMLMRKNSFLNKTIHFLQTVEILSDLQSEKNLRTLSKVMDLDSVFLLLYTR